jgi:hypothetical protein
LNHFCAEKNKVEMNGCKIGIHTYNVAGTYLYRVARNVTKLKVQVWGGGGGSGFFYQRRSGNGGGGCFVEAIINVQPFSVLEIVVGGGGCGGVRGTEIEAVDINKLRQEVKTDKEKHSYHSVVIDSQSGVALGGMPGGGEGYGGSEHWAAGGGGLFLDLVNITILVLEESLSYAYTL